MIADQGIILSNQS